MSGAGVDGLTKEMMGKAVHILDNEGCCGYLGRGGTV